MGINKSATGLVDVYGWVCGLETDLSDDRSSRLELGILRSGKMITLCAHSIGKQISLFLWLEPRGPGESECLGELGNCLIEECTEEKKMQQNLFPLFSRLCFYAFFGIIYKDIVELKIPRSKKKISEKDIEQLLRLEIEPGIIEASVYKRAFNILFYAACCSHLIHREAKLKELAAKLKELAAEALKIIGPAATESVMKSLASKYTQILLEYEDRSVDKFKFSYSSSFARYWTIHCYCPCLAMQRKIQYNMDMVAGLEYALSHQLLQCMLHVRHDVNFQADWIEVELKIDNLQCKSLQLDSHEAIPRKLEKEWYFPAKIMITMEPECKPGIRAVSLGMSSQNPSVSVSKAKTNERGLQVEQSVKIALQPELESKLSLGFTDSRTTSYTRIIKNWLFDPSVPKATQGRLEWTLYDNSYGMPVFSHQPDYKDRHYKAFRDLARGVGSVRPFTQEGGIVFARDLYGVPITWRLDRDLEGQTLVWFVECEIWLAYYPNQSHTGMEVRYQKFRQPVRLPLVPAPVQHRVSQPTNWWSTIASRLPGRTDNEIKNVWNTHLKKRLLQREIDPATEAKATRSTSPMEGHSLISVGYRDVSVESSTSMKEDTLPDNSASVDDLATVCNLSDSFYDSHNVSSQIFSRMSSIGSENNTVDSTSTLDWLQSNCVNYFDDPKFEDLLIDETFILGNQIFDNEERRLPRQSENATAMTSSKGMCEHISNLKAQYFTSACLEDDFLSCMDATDTNTNLLPLWNMELETNDDEASDDTHYWLNVLRQVGSSAVL